MKKTRTESFKKVIKGHKMIIKLEGRIENKVPELVKNVEESLGGVDEVVFDLKTMDSISAAGLRALSTAQHRMRRKMVVKNASKEVRDFFEATGYDDILNLEGRKHRIA